MCAILGILNIKSDASRLRKMALRQSKLQRHRGPDWSGVFASEKLILVHERLSIVDIAHGAQPLISPDGRLVLGVNGEIYNHNELEQDINSSYTFRTSSDGEVILPMYKQSGSGFLKRLNGIFAFIVYDTDTDDYLIARDHMGIIPLYMGNDREGNFYIASEMKSLINICSHVEEFPPGHYMDADTGTPKCYYSRH